MTKTQNELRKKAIKVIERVRIKDGLNKKEWTLNDLQGTTLVGISSDKLKPTGIAFVCSLMEEAGLNPKSKDDWFYVKTAAVSYAYGNETYKIFKGCGNILTPPIYVDMTYGLAIDALKERYKNGECPFQPFYTRADGSKIVRPFTLKENIQARVEYFNILKNNDGSKKTLEERFALLNNFLDSCTGVIFPKNEAGKRFKIIMQCPYLIDIEPAFQEEITLKINEKYENIDGIEIDLTKLSPYFRRIIKHTKKEIFKHPAWLVFVEEDKTLLSEYVQMIKTMEKGYSKEMNKIIENSVDYQMKQAVQIIDEKFERHPEHTKGYRFNGMNIRIWGDSEDDISKIYQMRLRAYPSSI